MFKHDRTTKAGSMTGANQANMRIGVVTDNVEPKGDYRVKIKFPTLAPAQGSGGQDEDSFWCRISTFGAGKGGRGMFALPEKDDEVLVAFIDGDINQAVVVGTLWGGVDKPAYSNKDGNSPTQRYNNDGSNFLGQTDASKNDVRSFSSRAKHELIFNDNASNPRVTIQSGCNHRIVLNDAGNQPTKIEIYDGKEENYILIDTQGKKITVESKTGDILIKAKEKVRIEAKTIETESSLGTSAKAGTNYQIQASSNVQTKAGANMDINAGATMTHQAALIKLN
jgi:uncharacterized protein involved in type VI secretion and phage assembly